MCKETCSCSLHTHTLTHFVFICRRVGWVGAVLCQHQRSQRLAAHPQRKRYSLPQPNIVKTRFVFRVLPEKQRACGGNIVVTWPKHAAVSSRSSSNSSRTTRTTYSKQICFAGNYDNSCLVQFPSLPFSFLFTAPSPSAAAASQCIFQRNISYTSSALRRAIYSFL